MGSLTKEAKATLYRDGFGQSEIEKWDSSTTVEGEPQAIDVNTQGWRQVRKDREKVMRRYTKGGATRQQFNLMIINRYTKNKEATPWDFLKEVYGRWAIQEGKELIPSDRKAMAITRKMYGPKWWL